MSKIRLNALVLSGILAMPFPSAASDLCQILTQLIEEAPSSFPTLRQDYVSEELKKELGILDPETRGYRCASPIPGSMKCSIHLLDKSDGTISRSISHTWMFDSKDKAVSYAEELANSAGDCDLGEFDGSRATHWLHPTWRIRVSYAEIDDVVEHTTIYFRASGTSGSSRRPSVGRATMTVSEGRYRIEETEDEAS